VQQQQQAHPPHSSAAGRCALLVFNFQTQQPPEQFLGFMDSYQVHA
jgi:hypothetical protein